MPAGTSRPETLRIASTFSVEAALGEEFGFQPRATQDIVFDRTMAKDYTAHLPWSPERPETLVVCCSDGRWHAHVEEFVHHEVSERADLFAVPGGPACIDPWNSTFDESRVFDSAMRLFVEFHVIDAVWLIAHQGCAYYKGKHPQIDERGMRRRQEEDMQRARQLLVERHPKLAVRRVYASLNGRDVVFTTLD